MSTLAADVRYAVRVLVRAPSFALTVIAVLALGIGANTAIFSILNAVLLRPLPFEEPDRLVRLFHVPPQATFPGMARFSLSPANFYDWQRDAKAFEGMAMYRGRSFTLTGTGSPRAIVAAAVGAGFFEIVRARPALGRSFRADEDRPDARVVILSHRFWQTSLGGARDVLERTLQLDGEPHTIVGVMPRRFEFPLDNFRGELWTPLAVDAAAALSDPGSAGSVVAIGRLRAGRSTQAAEAEARAAFRRHADQDPATFRSLGVRVIPLSELSAVETRLPLGALLAALTPSVRPALGSASRGGTRVAVTR
jgi:putative ABC transport system permease protein